MAVDEPNRILAQLDVAKQRTATILAITHPFEMHHGIFAEDGHAQPSVLKAIHVIGKGGKRLLDVAERQVLAMIKFLYAKYVDFVFCQVFPNHIHRHFTDAVCEGMDVVRANSIGG